MSVAGDRVGPCPSPGHHQISVAGVGMGVGPFPLLSPLHPLFWANFAVACKTGTLGSLYCHALLILSKSKNRVVHKQKFKDLLSSTWLTGSERRVLDLESEVMRCLGSMLTEGNIFSLGFLFSHSGACYASIDIIANVVCLWKTRFHLNSTREDYKIVCLFTCSFSSSSNSIFADRNVMKWWSKTKFSVQTTSQVKHKMAFTEASN